MLGRASAKGKQADRPPPAWPAASSGAVAAGAGSPADATCKNRRAGNSSSRGCCRMIRCSTTGTAARPAPASRRGFTKSIASRHSLTTPPQKASADYADFTDERTHVRPPIRLSATCHLFFYSCRFVSFVVPSSVAVRSVKIFIYSLRRKKHPQLPISRWDADYRQES